MNLFTIQLSHLTVTVMLIRQALFATKLIYWVLRFHYDSGESDQLSWIELKSQFQGDFNSRSHQYKMMLYIITIPSKQKDVIDYNPLQLTL